MAAGNVTAVRLLGAFTLLDDAGPLDVRLRTKEEALLGFLLLEGGRWSRRWLAQLLWPELPLGDARNNLRVSLSRIRAGTGGPAWLGADRTNVWIGSDTPTVDASELLAGDVAHFGRGELLGLLDLDGCAEFMDWLHDARQRVRIAGRAAVESAARSALEGGEVDTALALADRMVAHDRAWEVAHELRVLAMLRAGEDDGARASLRTWEQTIGVELGVEPGRRFGELQDRLGGSRSPRGSVAPLATPGLDEVEGLSVTAAPRSITSFHGREPELAELERIVRQRATSVVSVVGVGGVGKTRLATEFARTAGRWFQEGVSFVPLIGITTGTGVVTAVAESLGLTGVPATGDATQTLVDRLADRDLLLVLDNADQVVPEVARITDALARGCPYVRMLVTSRAPLQTRAEHVVRLAGLPHPAAVAELATSAEAPAVAMLRERAARVTGRDDLVASDAVAVVEICRAVEGQPLGLELAAAALATISLADVAHKLVTRPSELPVEVRDMPAEHRSLATLLDGLLALCSAEERTALVELSVFRGGFTPEAVLAVTGAGEKILRALHEASLVEVEDGGRHRLHELIRQLATEFFEGRGDRATVEARHAEFFLTMLADLGDALSGANAAELRGRLVHEHANIVHAWSRATEWGAVDQLATASAGLVAIGEAAGWQREVAAMLDVAATTAENAGAVAAECALRERWLRLACEREDVGVLASAVRRVTDLATTDASLAHIAARAQLTWVEVCDGRVIDPAATDAALASARQLAPADDEILGAFIMANAGLVAARRADFVSAERELLAAIETFRSHGHVRGEATARGWLAPVYAERYDIWQALESDRAALRLFTQLGDVGRRAYLELNVGASYILLGAWERAHEHTSAALALHEAGGDRAAAAYAQVQRAETLEALGMLTEATRTYELGIGRLRELGQTHFLRFKQVPWTRHLLGLGRALQAQLVAEDIVATNVAAGSPHFEATGRALLAVSLADQGLAADAMAQAELVWSAYGPGASSAHGLPWPLETLVDLHHVFVVADDERAAVAWDLARATMLRTAVSIPDPALRACYLGQVAVCGHLAERPHHHR